MSGLLTHGFSPERDAVSSLNGIRNGSTTKRAKGHEGWDGSAPQRTQSPQRCLMRDAASLRGAVTFDFWGVIGPLA